MLMIAFTIALGASLATAMLNVMLDVGDKVNQELKTYGANINVRPKGASLLGDLYGIEEGSGASDQYLKESELGNIKMIFWAFNVVDFAPYLDASVRLGSGGGAAGNDSAGGAANPGSGGGEADFGSGGDLAGGEAVPAAGGGEVRLDSGGGETSLGSTGGEAGANSGGGEARADAGGGEVKLVGTWISHRMDLPTGESLDTGMKSMKSWWDVAGEWLADQDEGQAMVGSLVAGRNNISVGDAITVETGGRTRELAVKGIFNAGSDEDEQIYVPLRTAQELTGRAGLVSSVEVSALTTPDNELSRRAAQNIKSLSIKEYEIWYCTA
jgi:ABC-type antimicrobial peptide transport system permease subunit